VDPRPAEKEMESLICSGISRKKLSGTLNNLSSTRTKRWSFNGFTPFTSIFFSGGETGFLGDSTGRKVVVVGVGGQKLAGNALTFP